MSRRYKYICADLATNEILNEVPFYGVNLNRAISGAADATFSINLDNSVLSNADTLEATIPARTIVYVDVDSVLIGGWILFSRTYQSQAKVLNLTARTPEAWPGVRDIEAKFTRTQQEQRNVFCDLWTQMQTADPYSSIGVQLPNEYPFSDQVLVDSLVQTWDFKTYEDEMRGIADTDTGFDWTIDIFYNGYEPQKKLRIGYPNLGLPLGELSPVFEYPGAIRNYYYPETTSNAGTNVTGIGAGEGSAMLRHTEVDQVRLDAGYVRMDYHIPFKDEQNAARLAARTRLARNNAAIPVVVPSAQMSPEQLGTFDMGDMAELVIKDPRFPSGISIGRRITGWSITPPSSDAVEEVRVLFEGGDSI